ncbi:MAG: hypothetical protein EBE86_005145 [Hormoscilla sp. GUM202]|nr:hypothetical protein [Hormoscilla sp. GUM202]
MGVTKKARDLAMRSSATCQGRSPHLLRLTSTPRELLPLPFHQPVPPHNQGDRPVAPGKTGRNSNLPRPFTTLDIYNTAKRIMKARSQFLRVNLWL